MRTHSKTIKHLLVFACLFGMMWLTALPAFSIDIPRLKQRVNDYGGVLDARQVSTLENLLMAAEQKTSSQVVLLIIPSLEGESLEDYSVRVAQAWQIGQKGYDNGVLLLVAMAEKKIRIEVGYGLEHIITDAKSSYIIRKLMIPSFKSRDYYGGISRGLSAVTGLISEEFQITPEQLAKFKKESQSKKGGHLPFGFIVFIIIVVLSSFRGGGRRGYRGGGGIFWGGGFGGGGSSFGGGGGFSGGGGSFGGGGASGGW